MDVTIFYIYL